MPVTRRNDSHSLGPRKARPWDRFVAVLEEHVVRRRDPLVGLSFQDGRTGEQTHVLVVNHVTVPTLRAHRVDLEPTDRFTVVENARPMQFGEGDFMENYATVDDLLDGVVGDPRALHHFAVRLWGDEVALTGVWSPISTY